jgi:hypothetical protein
MTIPPIGRDLAANSRVQRRLKKMPVGLKRASLCRAWNEAGSKRICHEFRSGRMDDQSEMRSGGGALELQRKFADLSDRTAQRQLQVLKGVPTRPRQVFSARARANRTPSCKITFSFNLFRMSPLSQCRSYRQLHLQ